ncbi:MAG: choice-of-anchor Q domain-containing protein [Trueperaceae bacterium]|nr:choice-of-anchor Q domain-containing protein [Trueperaceae bacterium]
MEQLMNKNLYNALTSFTYRTLLLVAVSVLLLAACTRSPAPEASVPGAPDTFRGLAQITFSDLNSDQPQSQMTFHPLSGVEGQALTALTGGLELGTVTPGGFTFNGVTTDDCDNTGGTRFLYASYEVRNADMSGAAYTVARKNLTFLAIDNNGADYGDNAVASLSDAGGNLFAPDDATAIDFANCLKPTHQTESDGTGLQVVPNGADMQVFTESEISGLGLIGTGTISNVFPYGYVVRNTAGGRTLAASPAAGQFDGVITFAVRVPDSDTNFPQSFSLWFYVFENDETFVTEDLTEQGSGTAEVRADTLDASTPIRLLGNSSTTPTGNPTNRLCQVRTSGTDASPNKLLVEVTGDICFTDERIYVNENATGGNDGTTWAEAFTTLQDALAAARSNTAVKEIWVAGGTYYPDEGAATNSAGATLISPNDNRSATFFVSEGIKIYGGFAGGETNRSGRDPVANLVTLSGDIDQNTGLNAYHVMYLDGSTTAITNATVIDGVTVTAGQANGSSPNERGGGMYNLSSSPTLTNVTFSGNTASNSGGAMYNYDSSSPTLTDVTFSGNLARFGGAMFNYASSPTLTNVTFSGNSSDNSSSSGGGAMYNSSSSPTLTNVTFSDNSASGSTTDNGGAMFNTGSSPTLNNVTFSGNSASGRGGTMYNSGSSPALNNVTFSGNSASDRGGAMYNNNSSSPTLTNVTFSGNSASFGGAMYNADSSPTLTNVTFSDNSASDNGGAMYNSTGSPTLTNVTFSGNSANDDGGAMYSNYSSSPTLTNVILWSNTATNGGNQIFQNRGILTINYSIVQGGSDGISLFNSGSSTYSSGTGNLNADPLFTDANGPDNISGTADDDLSLQACSPAIDAGDNTAISLATDLAGNSRNVDDTGVDDTGNGTAPIVDIGALEFQGVSASCNVIRVDKNATGNDLGYTWDDAVPNLQDALAIARSSDRKEIWIADGTYYPDEGAATDRTGATLASPDNNRNATFFVGEGIKIYGGFAGGETNRSGRDPAANVVTLSGDIDQGINPNAYHVMYLDGSTTAITNATVIDGVTVTAGQADGSSFPDSAGGAMFNTNSSPTLNNVTFSGNTASNSGGAMYNRDGSSPTLHRRHLFRAIRRTMAARCTTTAAAARRSLTPPFRAIRRASLAARCTTTTAVT